MPKPRAKDPRRYLVNVTTFTAHLTASENERCAPRKGNNIGYDDDTESLIGQGFTPCPFCMPDGFPKKNS